MRYLNQSSIEARDEEKMFILLQQNRDKIEHASKTLIKHGTRKIQPGSATTLKCSMLCLASIFDSKGFDNGSTEK